MAALGDLVVVRETTVVVIKWVANGAATNIQAAPAPAPVVVLVPAAPASDRASLQVSHLESLVRVVNKYPVLGDLTALRYGCRCCEIEEESCIVLAI